MRGGRTDRTKAVGKGMNIWPSEANYIITRSSGHPAFTRTVGKAIASLVYHGALLLKRLGDAASHGSNQLRAASQRNGHATQHTNLRHSTRRCITRARQFTNKLAQAMGAHLRGQPASKQAPLKPTILMCRAGELRGRRAVVRANSFQDTVAELLEGIPILFLSAHCPLRRGPHVLLRIEIRRVRRPIG